jgi:hypothetical protein
MPRYPGKNGLMGAQLVCFLVGRKPSPRTGKPTNLGSQTRSHPWSQLDNTNSAARCLCCGVPRYLLAMDSLPPKRKEIRVG